MTAPAAEPVREPVVAAAEPVREPVVAAAPADERETEIVQSNGSRNLLLVP